MLFYGVFLFFGWCLLELLEVMGDDLLWCQFGIGIAAFGGMAVATLYSMKKQQIGWWEQNEFPNHKPNCVCFGIECYDSTVLND